MTLARTFSRIYRRNLWKGDESLSGPGSGFAPTRRAAGFLVDVVREYGVRSVLDVGCGDSVWLPDLPGYLGVDVAPEAVSRASSFHPERSYVCHDATLSVPPGGPFDLVLVRDVIQHLPLRDGVRLLSNLRSAGRDGSRPILVASTYTGTSERYPKDLANVDIRAGDAYSPVLTDPPFGLPEPDEWCPDGWDYGDGATVRDGAKRLALWVVW